MDRYNLYFFDPAAIHVNWVLRDLTPIIHDSWGFGIQLLKYMKHDIISYITCGYIKPIRVNKLQCMPALLPVTSITVNPSTLIHNYKSATQS